MKRTIEFFRGIRTANDNAAVFLLLAVCLSALVTVSILFSQPMADAALKRFQLASASYPVWAMRQCVPRMYNFQNKIWFVASAAGNSDPTGNSDRTSHATVNHFPARYITYGDLRAKQFRDSEDAIFKMESTFRGRKLTSIWQIEKGTDGVLKIQRVSQRLSTEGEPE